MRLSVNISRGAYQRLDDGLTVPNDGGRYVRLKHWDELGRGDNVNPFPEIMDKSCGLLTRDPSGREYDYVPLPDEWQWFLWRFWDWSSQYKLPRGRIEEFYKRPGNERTFARTTPGSLSYVYVDMVEAHRAFTESASPEGGFRDVVTSRNMSNPKPYAWLFRPTGGAMCRVIGSIGAYYTLEAIDALSPVPAVEDIVPRPWLYFWCTQYGKYIGSTRFPQIKTANAINGYPPAGIASPLLSMGGSIKMLKSSCVELTAGQAWSPYVR
jgi:hypothetical protein